LGEPKRSTALLLACLLVVAGVVLVSGCGGDNQDDEVRDVIQRAFTEPDRDTCTDLVTQRFLDQTELPNGKKAVESCKDDADDTAEFADSAAVSSIEVDGDEAHANASIEGGENDGQRARLALVKGKDQWKLDELEDLEIDRARFNAAGRASLRRPPLALDQGRTECIVGELDKFATSEIEKAIVEGKTERLLGPLFECLGNGDPRAALEYVLRRGFREEGATEAQADCIVGQLRNILDQEDAESVFRGDSPPELEKAAQAAANVCVKG
jgi:hypothetical protein